ncbi:hypothetical protein ISG33_09335 [Glaciecola sp. MH2013]|uniref:hypothetical protein n=1 Tax=Glaciecola sp. MH2013 TaxID=2785524 RepID=UPI00189D0AD9|nr:hypothetical protein [Glaciecola sp. MH2013]MBF7073595.1 hypothetical protein [Glaciecola sp. MH2013]
MLLIAIFFSVVGVCLLCHAWKTKRLIYTVVASVLLLASIVLWVPAYGLEFALFMGVFSLAILVWLPITLESQKPRAYKAVNKATLAVSINWRGLAVQTSHAFFVLFGLMLCSSLIAIAFVYSLPMAEANQIASGLILAAVLWAVLAFCFVLSIKKLRCFLIIIGVSTISAASLFVK